MSKPEIEPTSKKEKGSVICQKCGKIISNTAKYCGRCGEKTNLESDKKEKTEIHPDILRYFQELSGRESKKYYRTHKPGGVVQPPVESLILLMLREGKVLDAFDFIANKAGEFQKIGNKKGEQNLRELQRKFPMAQVREERTQKKQEDERIETSERKRKEKRDQEELLDDIHSEKKRLERIGRGEKPSRLGLVRLAPEQQKEAEKLFEARQDVEKAFEEKEKGGKGEN